MGLGVVVIVINDVTFLNDASRILNFIFLHRFVFPGETRRKRSSRYGGFCSYNDRLQRDFCLRKGPYYILNYRWNYETYCYYYYETRCCYEGWWWGRRRVCKRYRVCKCIQIRCCSVTCRYNYNNDGNIALK